MKFDTYSDPSHGWCKVPFKKLVELGISSKISGCSFIRNGWVYLEEDSDLTIFMDAMNASGKRVEFREHTTNRRSRLRSYDRYPYTERETRA